MGLIASCACGTGVNINNLGEPGCLIDLKAPQTLVFASRTKKDGTALVVDTAALDQAGFDALFLAEEPIDRLYPLFDVKNFDQTQGDSSFDEATDGSKEEINRGIVTSTIVLYTSQPPVMEAKIRTHICQEEQMFIIDRAGNLIGEGASATTLKGRDIAKNSLVIQVSPRNDEGTNKMTISWDYERASSNDKVDFIEAGQITPDLTKQRGLRDVNFEFVGDPSTTGGTIKMYLDSDGLGSRQEVAGVLLADMEGYNETTPGVVALLTFTDAVTPGTYTYTHAAETATDIFRIQGKAKNVFSPLDLKRGQTTSKAIV